MAKHLDEPVSTEEANSTDGESERGKWKKFYKYDLDVDSEQDDKAKEVLLCTLGRPHMRAFHCAWWSFFIAFFSWFSITPLLPYIQADLGLTKQEIWTSSIAAVGTTILMRLILGPLCDVYGPRVLMAAVLCTCAIPTACTGLIQTAQDLIIVRCFIGIAGGSFVMAQFWPSRMFTKEVVGTANGLVAGWGNLGAGVTFLVIGSYLMPLFELMTGSTEMAWRTICIVPAVISFITGVVIYQTSDDAPKGNYSELKAHKSFTNSVTISSSFTSAAKNPVTWILFWQYACCFGVELAMNNAAAIYFHDQFDLSMQAAGAIASIFGWLNFFARGMGGCVSDWGQQRWGMKGRVWIQTITLIGEGIMVLIFATCHSLASAIVTLVIFSLFVQAAEGTSFGIVPYIDPLNMGSVMGIVGAGGNVGAVLFGLGFRQLNYTQAYNIMGISILISSTFSIFLVIDGHSGIWWGKEQNVDAETGKIRETSCGEELKCMVDQAAA